MKTIGGGAGHGSASPYYRNRGNLTELPKKSPRISTGKPKDTKPEGRKKKNDAGGGEKNASCTIIPRGSEPILNFRRHG